MVQKFKVLLVLLGTVILISACALLSLILFRISIVNTNVNSINNSGSLATEQQQQCTCNCGQSIEMDESIKRFTSSIFAKPESLTILWLIIVVNLAFSVVVCAVNITTLVMIKRDQESG